MQNQQMKTFLKAQQSMIIGCIIIGCVVGILRINNMLYFDLSNSYDITPHFQNVLSILTTGTMPSITQSYEAHQAPLFYILTAWYLKLSEALGLSGDFYTLLPPVLFVQAMVWTLIVSLFAWHLLRRVGIELRILAICVSLLLPVNTIMTTMYTNDMPVMLFGSMAMFTLWQMSCSNRLTDKHLWLRAALFCAFAIMFKNNGIIFIGVYVAFAICIGFYYLLRKQHNQLKALVIASIIGVPLILIAWIPNAWHGARHIDALVENVFGYNRDVVTPRFFYTFDTEIFRMPFVDSPGERSFWSLQYVNLHGDYYNHWNSSAYSRYPDYELVVVPYRFPMPLNRYYAAVMLQYLGVPITLMMILGFVGSFFRLIRSPRRGILDGSLLVVLFTLMSQAAQLSFYLSFPYIRYAHIHARFQGFLYGFLFLVGVMWLWRWGYRHLLGQILLFVLFLIMTLYALVAAYFMWLPPI